MSVLDLNDSVIAQVRQAADLVDIVSQVTPLKLAGKSYKGLCPFHREKTPSFHVDRDKGLFYCFGCGTGGDVFKFLTLTERFTFPEAVEHVAARVGIDLPRRKTKSSRENDRDDLLDVIDAASEAFHQALGFPDNAAANYLAQRGVAKEIVTKYGFGYAPDGWDYIKRRLGGRYGEQKLFKAGLLSEKNDKPGQYYDRFRNRLMIPIHSETGALVGFGGRTLDGKDPKYLNSPESEIFNKSRLLYNLHRSKDAMRKIDRAILVEGYFDAIAIDFKGVPGVVASMGTSLTSGQASLLRRFTRRVVICYDGDDAGRHATLRAAPVLLSAGLHVEVLDLLGEKDPDTLVEKFGVDRFLELLGNASDIFSFGLKEWGAGGAQLSGREKSERVENFVPLLSAVTDPVVRNDAAQRIANAFNLEFDVVWSRVRGKAHAMPQEKAATPTTWTSQRSVLAAALQGLLPMDVVTRLDEDYFEDAACRTLFSITKNDLHAGKPIDFPAVSTQVKGEAELTLLSELVLGDLFEPGFFNRIEEAIQPLEHNYIERRKQQIQREIAEASRLGNDGRVQELLEEKQRILRMSSKLK